MQGHAQGAARAGCCPRVPCRAGAYAALRRHSDRTLSLPRKPPPRRFSTVASYRFPFHSAKRLFMLIVPSESRFEPQFTEFPSGGVFGVGFLVYFIIG